MEEAAAKAALEENKRMKNQLDLQDRFRLDLEREKMVTTAKCKTFGCGVIVFIFIL